MTDKTLRAILAVALAAAVLFTLVPTASAAPAAANITGKCSFFPSSNGATFKNCIDGKYGTSWTSAKKADRYIDIAVSAKAKVGGVYFVWTNAPARWELFAFKNDGSLTSVIKGGEERCLTQYVNVPSAYSGYRRFRLVLTPASPQAAVSLAELSVYGKGPPPYYAPMWEPFTGRADMLTIVAHPDDEDLYLGMPMVESANSGKKCETVYMTYGSSTASARRLEAQESAWSLGNRWYPEMGNFIDMKTVTKEDMMKYWPLDAVVSYLVEMIRKYKPSVIVTHDVKGEYWHGAHRLTEYAATLAFRYAGDPEKYPASAQKYGAWKPGKLYVHLYSKNAVHTMNLSARQKKFGNRTVLQVIRDAYSRQKSQLPGRGLPVSGDYDMRKWGLFSTNLGPDRRHTSLFENVSQEAMLKLNPSYNYEVVDRTGLKSMLDEAGVISEAGYTPESWTDADLPAAIAAAQAVMEDRTSTQAQVDGQTAALAAAMGKLLKAAVLEGIAIESAPARLSYWTGEQLDLGGLALAACYDDGSHVPVPAGEITVSGFDPDMAGRQTVTLSYKGKTASFDVEVSAPVLTAIRIASPANKLVYQVGDALDLDGLVVSGVYSDGGEREVRIKPSEVSGFDSAAPAAGQKLTITVGGLTASYTIDILAADE